MSKIIFDKDTTKENKPSFVFDDPKANLRELMKRYDTQTSLIIGVLVVSLVIMIVMTGTLIIDSFHINSATYKEYSSKIDLQNQSTEINKKMLNEIQQNQILIKSLFNKLLK
jgi:hypothetical protein